MRMTITEYNGKSFAPLVKRRFAALRELDDKEREEKEVIVVMSLEQAKCLAAWLNRHLYGVEIRKVP